MILNFLKSLNERTKNIISWIINILIVTVISSLILCLIIGSIGHFANLSFMISLAGVCFLTFLITTVAMIAVIIILSFCLIVYVIKRDGLKKSFKKLILTFGLSSIILLIIHIFMPGLFIPILIFIIFILPTIGYYIWFWKKNKLWMVLIATNSQIVAINSLEQIVPDNFKHLYRLTTVIIGMVLLTIMYYRYWKVNKEKLKIMV